MDKTNQMISDYMGKFVHIVVDHPVGYRHGDIVYPINYGYIPCAFDDDGEKKRAYILGASVPYDEFDGEVIAIIHRKNDSRDMLVVAPRGTVYHQGQIYDAVSFLEQDFDIRIISAYEKSCGVLPYRVVDGTREFLLVFESFSKCWSLPKGHMEAGETEEQTALRELFEETGLTGALDIRRSASITYTISHFAQKTVTFYLGEVDGEPKIRAGEIEKFKWITAEQLDDYLFADTVNACKELLR